MAPNKSGFRVYDENGSPINDSNAFPVKSSNTELEVSDYSSRDILEQLIKEQKKTNIYLSVLTDMTVNELDVEGV